MGVYPVWTMDILRTWFGGVFRCGRPLFFGAKNFEFFEIYSVSESTTRFESVRIFC